VNITRVALADLPELLPLMRGYCDFYEVAPSDAALRKLSLTLLEHPDTAGLQLIARELEGAAIGFTTLYWTYSTASASAIGVMNDLYIAPHARTKGLGAALIRACEAECAARSADDGVGDGPHQHASSGLVRPLPRRALGVGELLARTQPTLSTV
jgi:GNAT superfamily N-acetyltransferase